MSDLPAKQAPAIVVRFELEAAPRVYYDCATEGERDRIVDWLDAHDDERDIVARAAKLSREKRAA